MVVTIVCVLRSGPEYKPVHVKALADSVKRHLHLPYRFICLTDMVREVEARGIEAVPLPQAWPGWFAKICLFAPGLLNGPVFYTDLDTVIVGPLDELVTGHRFTMCQDFYHNDSVNSSMMAWNCDLSAIYDAFSRNPQHAIDLYRCRNRWGDQDFIRDHTPIKPDLWQQKHPGAVVSFKVHVRPAGKVPDGASVVAFHGQPRPFALSARERSWMEAA